MQQRRSTSRRSTQLHLHRPQLPQQRTHLPRLPKHITRRTSNPTPQTLPRRNQSHTLQQRRIHRTQRISRVSSLTWHLQTRNDQISQGYGRTARHQSQTSRRKNRYRLLPATQNHTLTSIHDHIQSTVSMRLPELYRLLTEEDCTQNEEDILKQISRYS